MNYIKCFSRSPVRAANNLQPVFFVLVPPCWHGWSITPRAICARLVPPCWHGWSITPVCHLRPSWCLHAGTDGVLRPCAICARPGASMLVRMEYYAPVPFAPVLVPPCWYGWNITPPCHLRPSGASMLVRYTHYSISQILELFAVVTTPGNSL